MRHARPTGPTSQGALRTPPGFGLGAGAAAGLALAATALTARLALCGRPADVAGRSGW